LVKIKEPLILYKIFIFTVNHFKKNTKQLMQKLTLLMLLICSLSTSCSKKFSTDFTKKHKANFKVNGTLYNCGEDNVTASYFGSGSQFLEITCIGANGQTFTPKIVVDLSKENETVSILNAQNGFSYFHSGAVQYVPKRGSWKIISHEEGNPSSRHTEGYFEMTVYDPMNPNDTFTISEGYFYVNNY
jgi:hypothetical protein